jgi:hypothetical protein
MTNIWYETTNVSIDEIKKGRNIGRKIGEGYVGTVFCLKPDCRYVLKSTTKENDHQFQTEIKIGSIPGIEEVGPRVYGYYINGKTGERIYIMDNVAKMDGCKDCTSISLYDYLTNYLKFSKWFIYKFFKYYYCYYYLY